MFRLLFEQSLVGASEQTPREQARKGGVVCGHEDCASVCARYPVEEVHHLLGCFGVEVSGGFIGND